MVERGLIDHATEVITYTGRREFTEAGELCFPEGACFVRRQSGNGLAAKSAAVPPHFVGPIRHTANAVDDVPPPYWDGNRHVLYHCGCVVKRFKTPAPNQQRILAAFQEEDWPSGIDDPLPPAREIDVKRRLNESLKI
jgi:hypothetical protein